MQVQVSPKLHHFSSADWPRCVVCILFLWHFLGNTGYSAHVYGRARLHNVWECTTSVQNLHCQPGWHFEKKKQPCWVSCRSISWTLFTHGSVLIRRHSARWLYQSWWWEPKWPLLHRARLPPCAHPSAPLAPTLHTHCSGLQGARLVAEGYCATPCLCTNYMAPFHSFGRVPVMDCVLPV